MNNGRPAKKLLNFDKLMTEPYGEESETLYLPVHISRISQSTESIDLSDLFTSNVTESGSFDIRGNIWATTFGKLLQALPIPALLVNLELVVTVVNQGFCRYISDYSSLQGVPLENLFDDASQAEDIVSKVRDTLADRTPRLCDAILKIGGHRIWGRIYLRSIRIADERYILTLLEDLSLERKHLALVERHKKELRKNKETVEALLNATTDVAFLVDRKGLLVESNKSFALKYGLKPGEPRGKRITEVIPARVLSRLKPGLRQVVQTNRPAKSEIEHDGRDLENTFYPLAQPDGQVTTIAVFSRDITERNQAVRQLELAAKIFEGSNEAILVADVDGTIVNVNEAFTKLTGYSKEEVVGKNQRMMQSDQQPTEFYEEMWTSLLRKGRWNGEVWDRRKNGEVFPKLLSLSTVKGVGGETEYVIGIFSDITKIKQTERRLENLAHFDPLTDLPNRLLFRDRLRQALVEAARNKRIVALMVLDLDGFKKVNDTEGHPAGDEILRAVAARLNVCLRESDTVARLGGDEFAIVLLDISEPHMVVSVARKILHQLSQPFMVKGREQFLSASIGISLYPGDGLNGDRLLQNADMALYHAKNRGKNQFQYFTEEMNREVLDRVDLEIALREAIKKNRLFLAYQPQIDCVTCEVTGLEALVRWNHETRGMLYPGEFITVAEETGIIIRLGEWVLQTACKQLKELDKMGFPPMVMSVNVSSRQFSDPTFADGVIRILDELSLDPSRLELELTESLSMQDVHNSIRVFSRLKDHGVNLCIDDFGTGYSSLSYLKRFPIDKLKIDKSFVTDVTTDPDDRVVVRTIIAIAHSLGLRVLAEGVETAEQLQFLRARGCDEWQGYLASEALTPDKVVEFLRARSTPPSAEVRLLDTAL